MSDQVPTVTIKGGSKGTRIINASSFDPRVHTLADATTPEPVAPPEPGPAPAPSVRAPRTRKGAK